MPDDTSTFDNSMHEVEPIRTFNSRPGTRIEDAAYLSCKKAFEEGIILNFVHNKKVFRVDPAAIANSIIEQNQ